MPSFDTILQATGKRYAPAILLLVSASACTTLEPPPDPEDAPACCGGQGACLSPLLVEECIELLDGDGCFGDSVCVPHALRDGSQPPARCTIATSGAEGRCLPACLATVRERGELLAREGCAPEQRCIPCYDPQSGEGTGACSVNSDDGPRDPPPTIVDCCGGVGSCAPRPLLTNEPPGEPREEPEKAMGEAGGQATSSCD